MAELSAPSLCRLSFNTTHVGLVRHATPDILHILADVQITDVVRGIGRQVGRPSARFNNSGISWNKDLPISSQCEACSECRVLYSVI